MARQFETKVALVTGGASGIGLATAVASAREGARVIVADTQGGAEKAVGNAIRKEGGEFLFHVCDVSKPMQVQGLFARISETYGRLDIAVNNAGIEGESAFTAECDEGNWDRVLTVNLKGAWLCMKQEIPLMLKNGGGCIVIRCSPGASFITGHPMVVDGGWVAQ